MSTIIIWLFKKLLEAKNHLKKHFSEIVEVPQLSWTMPENSCEAAFS